MALDLRDADWLALARQGFVSREVRGSRTYFKLRYRLGQRQVVKYLGPESDIVEQVRRELAQLQAEHQRWRELSRLQRKACQTLRAAKRQLAPLLAGTGFGFHGMSVRRRRQPR